MGRLVGRFKLLLMCTHKGIGTTLFVCMLLLWLTCGLFGQQLAYGQQAPNDKIILSGTVVDKTTAVPLNFASVLENDMNGTATDITGHFALQVKPSAVVKVTFVGYKPFFIQIPSGFAGVEYTTKVLLEKDVIQLPTANVTPLTEGEFRDQFMGLKVETDDEKNARSNLDKIRAQGILGVIPQMDGFDNYRNALNGPQSVTFLSLSLGKGASKSRGLAPALKKAMTNPNKYSGPSRGNMPGSAPSKDKWYFNKPVPPPTRPDTTLLFKPTPADSLKPTKTKL